MGRPGSERFPISDGDTIGKLDFMAFILPLFLILDEKSNLTTTNHETTTICGVLRSAHNYGIAQLLAVKTPDSKKPEKDAEEFQAIQTFLDIMP